MKGACTTTWFVIPPGSSASNCFLTSTRSLWSACNVICHPHRRRPADADMYVPNHPGSTLTASLSVVVRLSQLPIARPNPSSAATPPSPTPFTNRSTPPPSLLSIHRHPHPRVFTHTTLRLVGPLVLLPTRLSVAYPVHIPRPPRALPSRDILAPGTSKPWPPRSLYWYVVHVLPHLLLVPSCFLWLSS